MIKELLIAVILGSLLGFGITGGYLAVKKSGRAPSVTSQPSSTTPTPTSTRTSASLAVTSAPTITTTPSPTVNPEISLVINSPENESIVSSSEVSLSGTTNPNSTILISTLSRDYRIISDGSGNFKTNIELDSGVNRIQIDSIDPNDNQISTQVMVTFSTAKI